MRPRFAGLLTRAFPAALTLALVAPASATDIAVAGYTYDFSQVDDIGGATTIHPYATDPSNTLLTDGDVGSLALVPFGIQNVAFPNGTWVGFTNHGSGNAYQPRIEFDLGGAYNVDSVQVSYLVEDGASVYAPNPVWATDPETMEPFILYNALTVATSSDGTTYTDAAFTNDFVLQADDAAAHAFEQRTATVDLGGASATHVSIEIHTPWSYIFLGEVTIVEGTAALPGDLNGDGYVGLDDLQPILDHWNQNVTVGDATMGDIAGPGGTGPDGYVGLDDLQPVLDHWNEGTLPAPSTVPEPATLGVLGVGGLLVLKRRA